MNNKKGFSLLVLILVLAVLGAAAFFFVPKVFGIKEDSLQTRRETITGILEDANIQLNKSLQGQINVTDQSYATEIYNKLGRSFFNDDTKVTIDFGFGRKPLEIDLIKKAQFHSYYSIDNTFIIKSVSYSNKNFKGKMCTYDVNTKTYSGACADNAVIE